MRRDPHGTSPMRPHPTWCPHPDVTRARCHHAVPMEVSPCPQRVTPSPASLTLSPKADVPGAADVLRWAAATPKCQPAPKGCPQRVTPSPGGDIVPSVTGSDPKGVLVPKGGGDPIPAVGAAIPPLSGCSQGLRCWGGVFVWGGGIRFFFLFIFLLLGGFWFFPLPRSAINGAAVGGPHGGCFPPPFSPMGFWPRLLSIKVEPPSAAAPPGSALWGRPIPYPCPILYLCPHPISMSPSYIPTPHLCPQPHRHHRRPMVTLGPSVPSAPQPPLLHFFTP